MFLSRKKKKFKIKQYKKESSVINHYDQKCSFLYGKQFSYRKKWNRELHKENSTYGGKMDGGVKG